MHRGPIPGRPKVEAIRRGISFGVNRQDAAAEAIPGFEQLELDPEIRQKSRRIEPRKPAPDDCNSRSHLIFSSPPSPEPYSANGGSKLEHLHQKTQSEPRNGTFSFRPPRSPLTGTFTVQSSGNCNTYINEIAVMRCTPPGAPSLLPSVASASPTARERDLARNRAKSRGSPWNTVLVRMLLVGAGQSKRSLSGSSPPDQAT